MSDDARLNANGNGGVPVALDLHSMEIAKWIAAGYKDTYGGTLRVETVRAGTVENGNAWKVTGDILPWAKERSDG